MKRSACFICIMVLAFGLANTTIRADDRCDSFPRFKMEELERSLKVGYAVLLVDVDHDGKRDIVVVDTTRVLWYENPTWEPHLIIEGQTKPDNVCLAPLDIDGDGKLDFALGADWAPLNTQAGGTLQWLKRGKTLKEKWSVHPIDTEPTIHRIRFADVDGDSKQELIVVPLMGKGSSRKKNWMDGAPVRVLAYNIPENPVTDRWPQVVLDQSLHVIHNFWPIPAQVGKGEDILAASYEGVTLISRDSSGKYSAKKIGKGNQNHFTGRLGASEVKMGTLKSGRKFIATVEPWHGTQIVIYTEPKKGHTFWNRHVIDDKLRWGHAVWCADMDGDGGDELIIGVRDNPKGSEKGIDPRGVRLYQATDDRGEKWSRLLVDKGGIACEDLAVADLNGDGRNDIVAVGRQTHNMRIYWNLGR